MNPVFHPTSFLLYSFKELSSYHGYRYGNVLIWCILLSFRDDTDIILKQILVKVA